MRGCGSRKGRVDIVKVDVKFLTVKGSGNILIKKWGEIQMRVKRQGGMSFSKNLVTDARLKKEEQ